MGGRKFFKVVAWYHWLWVIIGLTLLGILTFSREIVPYDSLGVIGTFFHYMAYSQPLFLKILSAAATVAHVLEGYYGYVLSRRLKLTTRDTILWTVQTTLVGFTSLLILKAKLKKKEKKK